MSIGVNVVDAIARSLREAIALGSMKVGEEVRAGRLAERFRVSRIPVREALKVLEGEGLLGMGPNRRTYVLGLQADEVRELFQLRFWIEDHLIRRAVPRLGADEIRRAELAHELLGREQRSSRQSALNTEFHDALYVAAGCPLMHRLTNQLRVRVEALQHLHNSLMKKTPEFQREHAAILAAAVKRDVDAAAAAVRKHLQSAQRIALAALAGQGKSGGGQRRRRGRAD